MEFTPFNISKDHEANKIYGENCGYSMHKCRNVNHYDHECPRESYKKKIFDYVKNRHLPLNPVSTSGPSAETTRGNNPPSAADHTKWVSKTCGDLRKGKYQDSPFWHGNNDLPIKRNRKSLFDQRLD